MFVINSILLTVYIHDYLGSYRLDRNRQEHKVREMENPHQGAIQCVHGLHKVTQIKHQQTPLKNSKNKIKNFQVPESCPRFL